VKRRRRIRSKQLLSELKEKGGYCTLKEEALEHTVWRIRFARGCGPVVRETRERMFTKCRGEEYPANRKEEEEERLTELVTFCVGTVS